MTDQDIEGPDKVFVRIELMKPISSITENMGIIISSVLRAGDIEQDPQGARLIEAYKQKRRYIEQQTLDIKGALKKRIVSILYEFEDWNANGQREIYDLFIKQLKTVEDEFREYFSLQIYQTRNKNEA